MNTTYGVTSISTKSCDRTVCTVLLLPLINSSVYDSNKNKHMLLIVLLMRAVLQRTPHTHPSSEISKITDERVLYVTLYRGAEPLTVLLVDHSYSTDVRVKRSKSVYSARLVGDKQSYGYMVADGHFYGVVVSRGVKYEIGYENGRYTVDENDIECREDNSTGTKRKRRAESAFTGEARNGVFDGLSLNNLLADHSSNHRAVEQFVPSDYLRSSAKYFKVVFVNDYERTNTVGNIEEETRKIFLETKRYFDRLGLGIELVLVDVLNVFEPLSFMDRDCDSMKNLCSYGMYSASESVKSAFEMGPRCDENCRTHDVEKKDCAGELKGDGIAKVCSGLSTVNNEEKGAERDRNESRDAVQDDSENVGLEGKNKGYERIAGPIKHRNNEESEEKGCKRSSEQRQKDLRSGSNGWTGSTGKGTNGTEPKDNIPNMDNVHAYSFLSKFADKFDGLKNDVRNTNLNSANLFILLTNSTTSQTIDALTFRSGACSLSNNYSVVFNTAFARMNMPKILSHEILHSMSAGHEKGLMAEITGEKWEGISDRTRREVLEFVKKHGRCFDDGMKCGNGVVDEGEECDSGLIYGSERCTRDCKLRKNIVCD